MYILGSKSDVRHRASRFETVQAETLARLKDAEAIQDLGELATALAAYVEQAEPVGVNRRSEIVLPKATDLKKPLLFMLREGEAGEFTLPNTTFKSDNTYLDGYKGKGDARRMTISPNSMSGYHSLIVAADHGKGRILATFPELLRVMPRGTLGYSAATMGHEIEHWRFMADQDHQTLGPVPIGIMETATERNAYRVNAAIEPRGRVNPYADAITRAVQMKDTIDPIEAYRIVTMPYVRTDVESRHQEAMAFSEIFGDGSNVPTDLEYQAYLAAGLIDSDHV